MLHFALSPQTLSVFRGALVKQGSSFRLVPGRGGGKPVIFYQSAITATVSVSLEQLIYELRLAAVTALQTLSLHTHTQKTH